MKIQSPTIEKIANLTTNGVVQTSGGDGTLSVLTTAATAAYAKTFNATTDWGSASGGYYTQTVNHALNTYSLQVSVWDTTSGYRVRTDCTVTLTDENNLTLQILSTPDERFAGVVIVSAMGVLAGSDVREKLTADRTYYVRTDGNDANTGLADTAGGAVLTIQAAVNKIAALDLNGKNVTIQIGDGTYTGTVVVGPVIGLGGGTYSIQGNSGTPSNVVISTTSAHGVTVNGFWNANQLGIKDLKLQTTTGGNCLQVTNSYIGISNLVFGACASYHINCGAFSSVNLNGNYTISGSALIHISCQAGRFISTSARTITLTGTPAWTTGFVYASLAGSCYWVSATFSGAATGPRYLVELNGICYTNGGGPNYFPGNSAGSAATGGQYV